MREGAPTRVRRAASVVLAATALVVLVPGAPVRAQPAPDRDADQESLADLETTPPVDTPGADLVLDLVPVEATRAVDRADAAFEEAASARGAASLRLAGAEQERARRALVLMDAGQKVTAAEAAEADAKEALAAAKDELARRRRVERLLRAALQVEQDRLRSMAAQLFTSVPDDRYLFLSDLDDITEASRRQAGRDRGVQLQSEAVEAAKAPWEKAKHARQTQQERTDDAADAADAATAALTQARDDRDHATTKLTEAAAFADATRADLDRASERATTALAERREARLEADAADVPMRLVALHAYWRAAQLSPCRIPWWLIAGVGRVETRHGTAFGSEVDADGNTTVHIIGIPLDGRPGTAAVPDTDGGALDGDPVWDRAVGPMQFLPGTWRVLGRDGNGDGQADPHNLYDAAAAAAGLLCLGGGDLTTEAGQRAGLLRYNQSIPYGSLVLAEGRGYRDALELPDIPPRPDDAD
ncbi:MAG: hypothetical protein R2701_09315 [Acidimicrobiales bacterium]|nr:hypothetical protein [Acidimicrobiales bacterium]